MSWKRLFEEATPPEREQIMFLLAQRIQADPGAKSDRSSRLNYHWLGPRRVRRRERPLFLLLLTSAVVLLEPHEFVLWAAIGGGGISIFLVLYLVYRHFPRKRVHWIS